MFNEKDLYFVSNEFGTAIDCSLEIILTCK